MRLRDYVNSSWFHHIRNDNDNSKNITIDLPLEFKVLRYLVKKKDTTVRNIAYPDPLGIKEAVECCSYFANDYLLYTTIREYRAGIRMQSFKVVIMSRNKPMTWYRDRSI